MLLITSGANVTTNKIRQDWSTIGNLVGAEVEDTIWDTAILPMGYSIICQVGNNIWDKVGDMSWGAIGSTVEDSINESIS